MYNEHLSLLARHVDFNSRYDRFFFQVLVFDYLKIAKNQFFRTIVIVSV